jgi:hypothetical protein
MMQSALKNYRMDEAARDEDKHVSQITGLMRLCAREELA